MNRALEEFKQRVLGEAARRSGIPLEFYELDAAQLAAFEVEQREHRAETRRTAYAKERARRQVGTLPTCRIGVVRVRRPVGDFSLRDPEDEE